MKYLPYIIGLVLLGALIYVPSSSSYGNVSTQAILPQISTDLAIPVGPQSSSILATRASNCTTRSISTASTSVMLSFSSALVPSGTVGTYQAASTTKEYDNMTYGCGIIYAWSPASSTVTVAAYAQ